VEALAQVIVRCANGNSESATDRSSPRAARKSRRGLNLSEQDVSRFARARRAVAGNQQASDRSAGRRVIEIRAGIRIDPAYCQQGLEDGIRARNELGRCEPGL